ncbi:MAG: hypothetical protein ACJAZN_003631 [Planctomycetota bacterium]|jgi:hypothetical protein
MQGRFPRVRDPLMKYSPRRRSWDVDSLMTPVTADQVRCSSRSAKEHEPRLWMDLVAEYDARLLQAELIRRGMRYSHEFRAFIDAWAVDEDKHADGLLRLYSLVCRESESSVLARLSAREGCFESLSEVLDDEFRLTLLFAYDEAMSTHGYSEDIPFYASLGPPAFETLIRELKNDEAVHYANAVGLLAVLHRDRVAEVRVVLDELIALDAGQESYRGTFVLDHATDQFSHKGMRRVGNLVGAAIVKRLSAATGD